MPEAATTTSEQSPATDESSSAAVNFQPPRLEAFNIPSSHEERLEWVRKSYERFFEKVREIDALLGLPELNYTFASGRADASGSD